MTYGFLAAPQSANTRPWVAVTAANKFYQFEICPSGPSTLTVGVCPWVAAVSLRTDASNHSQYF